MRNIKAKKFNHNMIKEIYDQPKITRNIIKKHIDSKRNQVIFREFNNHREELKKIKRFTFLGSGTSYHAAILGNYIFEEMTGLPCEYELAEEFNARRVVVERKTAFIIISQSGETSDALTAAYKVKGKGALLVALTNNDNSLLAKIADITINIKAGGEKAVTATKTFTAELINLYLLAIHIRDWQKLSALKTSKLLKELMVIPEKMTRIFKEEPKIKRIAEELKDIRQLIILGAKYGLAIALEAALKFKESAYLKTEGLETRELKHGPMAIVNKNLLTLFIIPKDSIYKTSWLVLKEVKKFGSKTLAITSFDNKSLGKITDNIIFLPKTQEIFYPLLSAVVVQLLAYYLAIAKNKNPDQPRHLKKYVS